MGEDNDFLYKQLARLGEMMGDGLHLEPDGKWISKEYKRILRVLKIGAKRENHSADINKAMIERIKTVKCQKCQGKLCQTRSGSMRAQCIDCNAIFQLLQRKTSKRSQKGAS